MGFTSALLCCLFLFASCTGLRISSKLNFDDDAAEGPKPKCNETDREKPRSFEAVIPFLVRRKSDGYEIEIPLTVEGKPNAKNKLRFLKGLELFERRTTEKTKESSSIPIVKGSLSHVRPDFLMPVPEVSVSIVGPHHGGSATDRRDEKIEGLKPPDEWILNTTPFLTPRNTTAAPPVVTHNFVQPPIWRVLESGVLNHKDPLSWSQERKKHWILRRPGWVGSYHYPTYQTRYPVYYPVYHTTEIPKGRWITCPPFEVKYDRATGRQVFPGCPQSSSGNSDVEIVNVTPVSAIDDKTLFRELDRMTPTKPEEPKVRYD